MLHTYVLFGFVYVGSYFLFNFTGFSDGSQVFALLILFLCVILYTMGSGESLQLLFMLCLSAISMIFVKLF